MTEMNKRIKITRANEDQLVLTLEECQQFFGGHPDFEYQDFFSAAQDGVSMKIVGDFFMWNVGDAKIPFRLYDGELYVAIVHPVVVEMANAIAQQLQAVVVDA